MRRSRDVDARHERGDPAVEGIDDVGTVDRLGVCAAIARGPWPYTITTDTVQPDGTLALIGAANAHRGVRVVATTKYQDGCASYPSHCPMIRRSERVAD